MAVQKQNQGWLIGIGVLLTLLWTSQISADWYKPHNEIGFTQHSQIELATLVEHETSGTSRVYRLESKPDSIALPSDHSLLTPSGRGLWLIPSAIAPAFSSQTTGLPGIRAPPRNHTSA